MSVELRIKQVIENHPVVLFMKGTRQAPQCGFSATIVQILDSLLDGYETVNVLSDNEIRQGIKEFSDWPTIPQLYVKGEFIGGCDIVKDLFEKGELEEALGVEAKEVAPPSLTVSDAAKEAFRGAVQNGEYVRLEIDARFQHALTIGAKGSRDLVVDANGFEILVDRTSARRANGVSIDYVDSPNGKAFKIENPNEPPRVRPIAVTELKARLDRDEVREFFDVRTPGERDIARIDAARLLDRAAQDHIMSLPKDTPLYFHCHHGGRSAQAAEFFLAQGFREVYNVEGGIDAWSQEIDPDIPRY